MALPIREHYAQPRGFVDIKCPIGRCDYKHRFPETDLTIEDARTVERRADWLRLHHKSGHLQRGKTPEQKRRALVFNALSMSLTESDVKVSLVAREEAVTAILRALDAQ
jgi:hypothetical protein